jgi:hypothetical protein
MGKNCRGKEKLEGSFKKSYYFISKSEMISRRLGGGNEAYCIYVEKADDDANKDSALILKWN